MISVNAVSRKRTKHDLRKNAASYAFALPYFLLFAAFTAIPVIITVICAFTSFGMAGIPKWAGFSNFVTLFFDDERFPAAFGSTLLYSLCGGLVSYLLSFIAAWLINEAPRFLQSLFTFIFCAPSLAGNVYMLRSVAFSGEPFAPLNSLLTGLGITNMPTDWLSEGRYAFVCALAVQLWTGFGIVFLTFRAALKSVDGTRYELGAVEGIGNRFGELLHITLPAIAPQALFAALIQTAMSFTANDLLGQTLINLANNHAAEFDMGSSCAVCTVIMALMLIVYGIIRRAMCNAVENSEHGELPEEHDRRRGVKTRSIGGNIAVIVLLILASAAMLFPILFTLIQSVKPAEELFQLPPKLYTVRPTANSFKALMRATGKLGVPFGRYLFNSVFVSVAVTAAQIVLTSMAAYVLAKVKAPLIKSLNRAVEIGLIFSAPVLFTARYMMMTELGMTDSYWALILPLAASPAGVFLMRQFIRRIPDSITEAAKLDGASHWRILWRVIMPNAKPALITLIFISFTSAWQSTGDMFVRSEELKLLPAIMRQLAENGAARAGTTYAVTVLFMLPPMILLAVFQKHITKALACAELKDR